MNHRNFLPRRARRVRHAFTLIEVLVALGILAILLVIIVLPLRLGFDSFNRGNAQNLTQSAVQATLTDMGNDIRDSVYVFPNSRVAGVTNQVPYTDNSSDMMRPPNGWTAHDARLPYYFSTDNTKLGEPTDVACSAKASNGVNPADLDMIQVRRDGNGNVLTPLAPSYNIVSYYARRQQLDKPYDPVDNPIVMYRAEYPAFGIFTDANGAVRPLPLEVVAPANAFNAKLDIPRINFRFPAIAAECGPADSAKTNRSSLWLSHNYFGERNLLPLTEVGKAGAPNQYQPANNYAVAPASYSQTLATPRGLALEANNANRSLGPVADAQGSLVPDTAFTTTDTNGDGKIDRVSISMGLASYDAGAQTQLDDVTKQPKGTVLRGSLTVDLPNIK